MHPKHKLVWMISAPIIAAIVAFWAWSLRYELAHLGSDGDLASLMDSFKGTTIQTGTELEVLQKQFDAQTRVLQDAFAARAAQAAVLGDLKAKVDAAAKAKDGQASAPKK